MPETYNTYVQLHINSHVSITRPIVKIEIAIWKYTQWKHVNFAKKSHIYRKNVFTEFSGNSIKEYFAKL